MAEEATLVRTPEQLKQEIEERRNKLRLAGVRLITEDPEKILTKKLEPFSEEDLTNGTALAQIEATFEVLRELKKQGIGFLGMAFPQIKSLENPKRGYIINMTPEGEEDDESYWIPIVNPHLYDKTGPRTNFEEGCLSIPGPDIAVKRRPKVTLRYLATESTKNGSTEFVKTRQKFTIEADGIITIVHQHEYGHLDGELIQNN